jgi:hypothetical protein
MTRDLDWGDVERDAEHERSRAEAGAVLDFDDDDDDAEEGHDLRADVELAREDWDQDEEASALTTYEAARSIRGSLALPQFEGDQRAWTWIDYGDAQSAAYRRVLEATDVEVEALRDA